MKIEQDVQAFQPVVITLESMAEIGALLAAVLAREEVLLGDEFSGPEQDFLATLSDFLGEVS